jgi:hypothetical protein
VFNKLLGLPPEKHADFLKEFNSTLNGPSGFTFTEGSRIRSVLPSLKGYDPVFVRFIEIKS